MMTFIVYAQPYLQALSCFLLQPFDDSEACFHADVGELSNLRIEVWLSHPPNKEAGSPYLKDKFEHKSYFAFIFSVNLYL